jgi:hypothetical protein
MAWDSKVSYRPDATRNVWVKATSYQKAAWTEAARRHGKASPGNRVPLWEKGSRPGLAKWV